MYVYSYIKYSAQLARCQPEVIKVEFKRGKRAEEELSKLTKLESFLTKIDKGPDEPKILFLVQNLVHLVVWNLLQ